MAAMADKADSSIFSLFNDVSALAGLPHILEDVMNQWRTPKFMILGVESCGKSTVMERLTKMPIFPRGRNKCSSCALQVLIRYASAERKTLEVMELSTGACEVIMDGLDGLDADRVSQEMQKLIDSHGGPHGICMTHGLVVRVVGPSCPNLDLIDMPGLVINPKERNNAVRQLLEDYFNKYKDLIHVVAVVQALDRPSNNLAMEWLGERHPTSKTCGVFTMCDKLGGEALETVCQLATKNPGVDDGRIELEPYGWVATMSRRLSKDKESPTTIEEMAGQVKKEQDYFQGTEELKPLWGDGCCCIGAVLARIRTMYRRYLVGTLGPSLAFRLDHERKHLQFQYVTLGMPEAHRQLDGGPRRDLKDRVVKEIASSIELATPGLLNLVVKDVLRPFKQTLLDIVKGPIGTLQLGTIDVTDLDDKWYAMRNVLQTKSRAMLEKVAEIIPVMLMKAVEGRDVIPQWPSQEALDLLTNLDKQAPLAVKRFPDAIQMLERHMQELMAKWQVGCLQVLDNGIEELFTPMSQFRKFTTNFDVVPPTATITVNATDFVENIMLAMLRQVELFAKTHLHGSLDLIQKSTNWKESCSAQREHLIKQAELATAARMSLSELPCKDHLAGKGQADEFEHPTWDECKATAIVLLKELHETSMAHSCCAAVTADAMAQTQVETDTHFTITLCDEMGAKRGKALPPAPRGGIPNSFVVSLHKTDRGKTRIDAMQCHALIQDNGTTHKVTYHVNKDAFSHLDPPQVTVHVTLHGVPVLGTPFTTGVWAPHWGGPVCSFGGIGNEEGQLQNPTYVASDAEFVYVSDYNNHRVSMFRKPPPDMGENGNDAPTFHASWGTNGTEDGQFKNPRGIAVRGNMVYVVDYGNRRVQVFGTGQDGGEPGKFICKFGSAGSNPGEFNYPEDVCADDEHAYVTDYNANKVLQFKRHSGKFVKDFVVGTNVRGVDVDGKHLFVAANGNNSIYKFNKDDASQVQCTSLSWQPSGLAVDEAHIYVTTHRPNNTVYVLKKANHANVTSCSPSCSYVWGCAVSLHDLYLVDYHNHCIQVVR